jgi:hypothetical protein
VNDGWAHVAVDGASVGDTPLTLAVPAGRHVVTLTRDDGKKKSVTVVVPAGDKLVLVRESL